MVIVDTTVLKYRQKSSHHNKLKKVNARSSSDYEKNLNWIKLFGHKNINEVISLLNKLKNQKR